MGGFVVGAVGAFRLYIPLFWGIQNSIIPAGRLPLLYILYVFAGLALGWLLVLAGKRWHGRLTHVGPR